MKTNENKTWKRKLGYVGFALTAFGLSFFLAYSLNYYPLGYNTVGMKMVNEDHTALTLEKNNAYGMAEKTVVYEPPEEDQWKVNMLVDLVNDQSIHYWVFFTSIFAALYWVVVDVKKGESVRKTILYSSLGVALTGLSLMNQLYDIKDILS
ncbi:hypothetical protein JF544_02180 [Halobacillus kuroshimensis]|uniref:Uncharacterized protein n=1 Tax=Halobacillus kuroshimensis TaxID=302481 RepID=A0ABS3DRQ7_9BACI|nr:hypothetical protein [Halobacillus kuroshimensis]MBN8234030.1 hypothetical protein [Halobacillus kuroshimensis]